jgi:Tol biopolymer transport system component
MNADGREQARLTEDPADDRTPGWSPSGAYIVFHSDRGGDFDIYLMGADGSDQTRLTEDPAAERSTASSWAPR